MRSLYKIAILFSLFLIPFNSFSQNSDSAQVHQEYIITKINGFEYIGSILSDDAREILIKTQNLGLIYLPKSDIKSIVKIEDTNIILDGQSIKSNPFISRYAFTTNALSQKKGSNYGIINLYGPEVHFSLSDHFNVGIISTWMASPFVVVAKYSFKSSKENVNFAIGSLLGTSGYIFNAKGYGGLPFLNLTLGTPKKNINFGGGYAYLKTGNETTLSDEIGKDAYLNPVFETTVIQDPAIHGPLLSIAGITPVGTKSSFIFDSMVGLFDTDEDGSQSIGLFILPAMRFQTKENKAFQISLAGVSVFDLQAGNDGIRDANFMPLPMCTWFYYF